MSDTLIICCKNNQKSKKKIKKLESLQVLNSRSRRESGSTWNMWREGAIWWMMFDIIIGMFCCIYHILNSIKNAVLSRGNKDRFICISCVCVCVHARLCVILTNPGKETLWALKKQTNTRTHQCIFIKLFYSYFKSKANWNVSDFIPCSVTTTTTTKPLSSVCDKQGGTKQPNKTL